MGQPKKGEGAASDEEKGEGICARPVEKKKDKISTKEEGEESVFEKGPRKVSITSNSTEKKNM